RVLVTLDDPAEAQEFDELLWTFKPESFIPHACLPCDRLEQVEITTDLQSEIPLHNHHNVLLNLSSRVPAYFSRFGRLSEVVIQQPEVLKNTREHYSFYRERGYPIQHRNLQIRRNRVWPTTKVKPKPLSSTSWSPLKVCCWKMMRFPSCRRPSLMMNMSLTLHCPNATWTNSTTCFRL